MTTHTLTTAEKLAALKPWQRQTFNVEDFSYQSCRFCRRVISPGPLPAGVAGLWKYEVRHYACDECRDKIITESGLARSGLYGTSNLSADVMLARLEG